MNFEEWFKKETGGCGGMQEMESWAEKAWDFQQAKIDILQIKLNGADERAAAVLNHKNKMIDELQARVDGALKILDGMRHNGAYRAIDILKGNKGDL